MKELEEALLDARQITDRPVLFDIKVLPKTMTEGYGAWWRVGTPEVADNEKVRASWQDHLEHIKDARQY